MPKKRQLVGERFGKLTVVENTGETQDRYAVWRCRCDCGGECLVNTERLVRGTVTSCGCVPKADARCGPVSEDLTGQIFGELTVIKRVENQRGRTCWLCRCQCGNERMVVSYELKAGRVTNCGCRRNCNRKDISGCRFGRLVAQYPTERRDSNGSVFWHCQCDCGNQIDVSEDHLVQGNYKSCGCKKKEAQAHVGETLTFVDGTCVEWLASRKLRSDNTSGFRGVYRTRWGSYKVSIILKNKRYYLGSFHTFEEAVQARLNAEKVFHVGFVESYRQWENKAEQDPAWAEANPFVYEVENQDGTFQVYTNGLVETQGRRSRK